MKLFFYILFLILLGCSSEPTKEYLPDTKASSIVLKVSDTILDGDSSTVYFVKHLYNNILDTIYALKPVDSLSSKVGDTLYVSNEQCIPPVISNH